jgi:hypothetical protein
MVGVIGVTVDVSVAVVPVTVGVRLLLAVAVAVPVGCVVDVWATVGALVGATVGVDGTVTKAIALTENGVGLSSTCNVPTLGSTGATCIRAQGPYSAGLSGLMATHTARGVNNKRPNCEAANSVTSNSKPIDSKRSPPNKRCLYKLAGKPVLRPR